jgi:hypothetical protein
MLSAVHGMELRKTTMLRLPYAVYDVYHIAAVAAHLSQITFTSRNVSKHSILNTRPTRIGPLYFSTWDLKLASSKDLGLVISDRTSHHFVACLLLLASTCNIRVNMTERRLRCKQASQLIPTTCGKIAVHDFKLAPN